MALGIPDSISWTIPPLGVYAYQMLLPVYLGLYVAICQRAMVLYECINAWVPSVGALPAPIRLARRREVPEDDVV